MEALDSSVPRDSNNAALGMHIKRVLLRNGDRGEIALLSQQVPVAGTLSGAKQFEFNYDLILHREEAAQYGVGLRTKIGLMQY